MWKQRIGALVLLVIAVAIGYFLYWSQMKNTRPFKLGLDLSGGSYLEYKADTSKVPGGQVGDAMSSLRDVIERRVNLFGVSEPKVSIETSSLSGAKEYHLIVELPGVTDVKKAIDMIGQTPLLEFKVENPNYKPGANGTQELNISSSDVKNGTVDISTALANLMPYMSAPTPLTGQYLERATLEFDQTTHAPVVALQFNAEGAKIFEDITAANIGKKVAIYLDGAPISTPMVNQKISGGQAIITGNFTPDEAKILVGRLNSGALPVPVSLISTDTIGPTLGANAIHAGMVAGLIGIIAIAVLLLVWYRLPGLTAIVNLLIYGALMLAIFKIGVSSALLIIALAVIALALIFNIKILYSLPFFYVILMLIPGALTPVTLTSAGIAGFIISLGMAVDANILFFERMKEEMKDGKTIAESIRHGFERAWNSIRDGNISSIISAVILSGFGSTLIKGFAITFGLGVIVSMFIAVTTSRIFLSAIAGKKDGRIMRFLFSSGLSK